MSKDYKIKNYVIAGGGTSGWMVAAILAKTMGKEINITLIESDSIGTVGVGEATIPPILKYNRLLQINEAEFMKQTNATFKLGIKFENWREKGKDYFHSFGTVGRDHWTCGFHHFWLSGMKKNLASDIDDYCLEVMASISNKFAHLQHNSLNYAYHFDSSLYAKFLRNISEENGAVRKEGKIQDVKLDDKGFVKSLLLENGEEIHGDFFFDCTGFKSLIMSKALKVGYDEWTKYLPCDSAIAVQTKSTENLRPYTRSIAHESGWQWMIPLQHRVGNGMVYAKSYIDKDKALDLLLNNLENDTITNPLHINFTTGMRQKQWEKNCVVIGLASGFMEPLESTSIHLIQRSILKFLILMPKGEIKKSVIDEYNRETLHEWLLIRDFLILHYHVTERRDSEFWKYCANMEIPDRLRHKIDLFKETAKIFRRDGELFAEHSWIQVMMGQGLYPEEYHMIADKMDENELKQFLDNIKNNIKRTTATIPSHKSFIDAYCKTKM